MTERVARVLAWAKESLAELELTERIRNDVSTAWRRTQREYLLRQQLAAIRKESGDSDEDDAAAGYRARVAELAEGLPESGPRRSRS